MSLLRHFSQHILSTLISLFLFVLIISLGVYFYIAFQLPDVATLKDTQLQTPLRIYTKDNQLIGEYGAMRRDPITLDQAPKLLLQAIIATEDQRFFEHSGVDFIGVIRAAKAFLITGEKTQGASTISMQVARNFFLSREKTFARKIKEMLLALKIENNLSKDEILNLYINKIYLGEHAYGVSAASEIYYGKPLNQLTLAQIATIAGLPQDPSGKNPIANPMAAKTRRNHVLARMLALHDIAQKAYEEAIHAPIKTYYHGPKITVNAPAVAEMVRGLLYKQYGESLYTSGFKVCTTLNSTLQNAANYALKTGLIAYEHRHAIHNKTETNWGPVPKDTQAWQSRLRKLPQADNFTPVALTHITDHTVQALLANGKLIDLPRQLLKDRKKSRNLPHVGDVIRLVKQGDHFELAQIPKVQGALIALRPKDGAILALNGGFNNTRVGYNRATQAQRQPGSNFKPFIYAAALAKGYTLATMINDSPITIRDKGNGHLWQPQDDDRRFRGPIRMRLGLVKSLNLVSIRVLQMIKIPYALDYLTRFGFKRTQLPPYLSLALGTPTVTPLQIARAYCTFANGGFKINPYFIDHIEMQTSKLIFNAHPLTAKSQNPDQSVQLAPQTIRSDVAYLITSALQDVIKKGTGYAARTLNRSDIAGKTGTTNDKMDAWFSGYSPKISVTVWVGYDRKKSLDEYGSQAALPIWIQFMKKALAGTPDDTPPPPPNIVHVKIDPNNGLLAPEGDPNAIFELFRKDKVPTEVSAMILTNTQKDNGIALF